MKRQTLFPGAKTLLVILMGFSFAGPLSAEEIYYYAYLSEKDRYNSNGDRLKSVADILRQDRANYHKGRRDRADEDDGGMFATTAGRAKFGTYSIVLENIDAAVVIKGVQKGVMVRVSGRKIFVSFAEFEEE